MIVQVYDIRSKIGLVRAIRLGLGYTLKEGVTLAEDLMKGPVVMSHAQRIALNWGMDEVTNTVAIHSHVYNDNRLYEVTPTSMPDWTDTE